MVLVLSARIFTFFLISQMIICFPGIQSLHFIHSYNTVFITSKSYQF